MNRIYRASYVLSFLFPIKQVVTLYPLAQDRDVAEGNIEIVLKA